MAAYKAEAGKSEIRSAECDGGLTRLLVSGLRFVVNLRLLTGDFGIGKGKTFARK